MTRRTSGRDPKECPESQPPPCVVPGTNTFESLLRHGGSFAGTPKPSGDPVRTEILGADRGAPHPSPSPTPFCSVVPLGSSGVLGRGRGGPPDRIRTTPR